MQTKTKEEIATALKCCSGSHCTACPYNSINNGGSCIDVLATDALNLIIDLDEKLTKKPEGNIREIVDSLKICSHNWTTDDCSECPYKNVSGCIDELMWVAADIIEIQDRKIRNNTAD